jgi:hypothetical protein
MIEQIRHYLKAVPFRPFEIHTSGGEVILVDHPENAAVVKSHVLVALPDGVNAIAISALHITAVVGLYPAEA